MATMTPTVFAGIRSTYLDRAIAAERSAVTICEERYEKVLKAMHRALSCELRDHAAIAGLLYDMMEAENRLACARMDLEEAESR